MTEFFLHIVPPTKTHQEKKIHVVNGKPVTYEPAELKAVRAKLEAHLAQHVPQQKYTGAVRLVMKWCFPITGNHKNGEYKITKPDAGNMEKTMEDVMTKLGFWMDDAIIASKIVEKFWATVPGIYVKIEEVG